MKRKYNLQKDTIDENDLIFDFYKKKSVLYTIWKKLIKLKK